MRNWLLFVCLAVFLAGCADSTSDDDGDGKNTLTDTDIPELPPERPMPDQPVRGKPMGGDWSFAMVIGSDADIAAVDVPEAHDLLHIEGDGLTDEGLADLKQWTSLERLYIQAPGITDQAVEQLAQLKNLKALRIGDQTQITDEGIERLREVLPEAEVNRWPAAQ